MKQKIINYLLRHVLKAIVADDVIWIVNNQVFLGNREVSGVELNNFISDARFLQENQLFQVIKNRLISDAHEVMFNKSTSYEDMNSGKMMLYNLDVQEKIIDKIANLRK